MALECTIMQKLQWCHLTIPNNGMTSQALLIISNWCHTNMTIGFYEFMIYFNMAIHNFSNANFQVPILMHTHAHKEIRNKLHIESIHIENQDLSHQILHTYIMPLIGAIILLHGCVINIPCHFLMPVPITSVYKWLWGWFENAYELSFKSLKFSHLNRMYIIKYMAKIYCVEFQRVPLNLHTKYLIQ